MEQSDKELILKANEVIEKLLNKASVFSKWTLIISIIDVLCGVLTIFYASLSTIALVMSCCSLTAITLGGRIIQIGKVVQLQKSLKTLNFVALAYILKRFEKRGIKMTKSTVFQRILTGIIAVFGAGGIVVGFLPQFTAIAENVSTYGAMAGEIVAVISGLILAGTNDKLKTEEEIAKDKAKNQAKEDKKSLAEAKALVKKYEQAKAKEEEYAKAKALVEAQKQENA